MALTPAVGSTYVLSDPAGHGEGVGALPAGTTVKVEAVQKTAVEGAAGEVIAAVNSTVHVDGEEHPVTRLIALGLKDFQRLFKTAGDK